MLHQYAHIKSLKSQPRESQKEKEGKMNFSCISSGWKDGFILKLSRVSVQSSLLPLSEESGVRDCRRRSVQVEAPPQWGRG